MLVIQGYSLYISPKFLTIYFFIISKSFGMYELHMLPVIFFHI